MNLSYTNKTAEILNRCLMWHRRTARSTKRSKPERHAHMEYVAVRNRGVVTENPKIPLFWTCLFISLFQNCDACDWLGLGVVDGYTLKFGVGFSVMFNFHAFFTTATIPFHLHWQPSYRILPLWTAKWEASWRALTPRCSTPCPTCLPWRRALAWAWRLGPFTRCCFRGTWDGKTPFHPISWA